MSSALSVIRGTSWFKLAWKSIALAASTGAALVTVFSALYSYGVVGKAESHQSIGNLGATWVGLQPAVETATAIGDTSHFVATVADKNGSILVGARPTWTTGDSTVATVRPDGSVIARGPGSTTVSAVVGALVAHARIHVRQQVAVVQVSGVAGDSGVVVPEGAELRLHAMALDARGHAVVGAAPHWQVDDSTVAALDTTGRVVGRNAGRTTATVTVDGTSARTPVSVVTTAAAASLVGGAEQRAPAGTALAGAIVVRAVNRRGVPAPGQRVSFRTADGQGTVAPIEAITDADGRARATWTLGAYPGRQMLVVAVDKVDSTLAVIAEADPVEANTRVAAMGEPAAAPAGATVGEGPAIRVTDSLGRALADVPVRWTALDGGAVEALAPRTDSLGVARARWTLGSRTGTQRIRAQVGGGSSARALAPVTLTAHALAGAAAGLAIVSGDAQRGTAGAALPKPVVVRVVDARGNGVADATIVLSPSAGTIPDSTLRTDSLGVVRTPWTMGRSSGEHTLALHVDGVKGVRKLTARALPGAPANLSFEDASPAERHAHAAAKGKRLSVLVTDVYGNPVPDVRVSLSSRSGIVMPARTVSDAHGRAAITWTPGAAAGEQTLAGVVVGRDVRGVYATHVTAPAHQSARLVSTRKGR
jgi:hypothetical protein